MQLEYANSSPSSPSGDHRRTQQIKHQGNAGVVLESGFNHSVRTGPQWDSWELLLLPDRGFARTLSGTT